MASKDVFVFAFLLFIAFCSVPIRGRDLSKRVGTITLVQGENSSLSVKSPIAFHHIHTAGYFALGKWHGVGARINVWGIPGVQAQSMSSAFIAARNQGEMVAAGIHVYPGLYKNKDLRFFTYWTTDDGVLTGCYNTNCKGFIAADGANARPGQALAPPFSVYNGEQKYITLRIKKDEQTGDWSLYREDQGGPIGGMTLLGWWPKTLFKGLSDYATKIEWKGQASYHFEEKSPPMGSGHHAEEYEGKSAFFKNILGFDLRGKSIDPQANDVTRIIDKPECYDTSCWFKGKHDGCYFFYGGPSGCSDK
ncbi:hypothetical protein LUZ60_015872 [Juncus effusus]|nr:hypothetical protein LUZ60_015872 [Juncus effusus]